MQIFLSYKQTGLDKEYLKNELVFIKNIIKNTWNSIYIYFFDELKNETPKLLIEKFKQEIKKSDLVIWLVNYTEKSEWELLELWIAEAMNKSILLLVNNKVKSNYSLIYWLNTDILYYDDISEIEKLLVNYLKWK